MRFHGILLTRDDEDIIRQNIQHALTWCDSLNIFETGGFDQTWDIVRDWARRDERIRCFQNRGGQALMESGLRGYVFERYRDQFEPGDWIVQVDSDEFYHVSPREFIQRLAPSETVAYLLNYEFRLTRQECDDWMAGRETAADRAPADHRSPPLLQHPSAHGAEDVPLPPHDAMASLDRISLQRGTGGAGPHTRPPLSASRSPPALPPLGAAAALIAQADPNWKHWQMNSWQDFLADTGDPELRYWPPCTPLPANESRHHLARLPKRAMQRLMHAGLMRIADRLRARMPQGWTPTRLSEDVVERIAEGYAEAEASLGGPHGKVS